MNDEEMKPSFYGMCFACGKKKEIVSCISWSRQKDSLGRNVFGGFRNFCTECEKKFNIGINRKVTVSSIFELEDSSNTLEYKKCSKCKRYYPQTSDYQKQCLICFMKEKEGKDDSKKN